MERLLNGQEMRPTVGRISCRKINPTMGRIFRAVYDGAVISAPYVSTVSS